MKVRWKDFEFEISDERELKLVVQFVREIENESEPIGIEKVAGTKKRNKWDKTYDYQTQLARKILLKKAIPKMEKGKWYSGKEIIELAGYTRSRGNLYWGLSKLVEEGILEEKREGKFRLFKLKSDNEHEDFNFRKMFLEEKRVMDGILR
jgi:DNA-binding transcriptional ArsR family regulator